MTTQEIRNRLAEIANEKAAALATMHSINFTTLAAGSPEQARYWDAKDTYDALGSEERKLEYKLTPDTTPTERQVKVADWVMSDDYDNE